jgi:hypothetical protein
LNFAKFVAHVARLDIPDISDITDVTERQQCAINNVGRDIREKLPILDKVSIPYIQNTISDAYDAAEKLAKKTGSDEVPEGILEGFSRKVFGKPFNNLDQCCRSIIAVLSVYILISL